MRFFTVISILMTLVSCTTEIDFVDLTESLDAGKCSYSVFTDSLTKYTHFENAFVIEVLNPIFEEEVKRYSMNELQSFKIEKNTFRIPTQDKHMIILLQNKEKANTIKSYIDGYLACKVEILTKEVEFTLEDLERANYEVKFKSLKSKAKLIKRDEPFEEVVRTDSIMNFKAGYYTPLLTAVGGGYKYQMDFVFKLQRKLVGKGFNLNETGTFDEKTLNAIKEFQKMNNLEIENGLDKKFFEVLEFDKE